MPDRAWRGPSFWTFGVSALCGGVQKIHYFTLIGFSGGGGLQLVPGGVDDVQYECETELSRRRIVAACRECRHRAHQIAGSHGSEQFLLHHAFVAGRYVMQPYCSFQRTRVRFDFPALAIRDRCAGL